MSSSSAAALGIFFFSIFRLSDECLRTCMQCLLAANTSICVIRTLHFQCYRTMREPITCYIVRVEQRLFTISMCTQSRLGFESSKHEKSPCFFFGFLYSYLSASGSPFVSPLVQACEMVRSAHGVFTVRACVYWKEIKTESLTQSLK